MARLERGMGVVATYYFRAVSESRDEGIIRKIASLGHEIGYHYENLAVCGGDMEKAFADFKANLERLRVLGPVSTVCMHGSPLSDINNLELLKRHDYKDLGLRGEPYLDVDFNDVFYLTDTGRRWDGEAVSVRDKVKAQSPKLKGKRWPRFHSTWDIIRAVEAGRFPDKVMMTVHPQRWDDRPWPWVKELVGQNIKNIAKSFVLQKRTKEAKG